jgi:hypothetical protein
MGYWLHSGHKLAFLRALRSFMNVSSHLRWLDKLYTLLVAITRPSVVMNAYLIYTLGAYNDPLCLSL